MNKLLLTALLAASIAPAGASSRDIEPPCKVQVMFILHTYTGPRVYEDICLTGIGVSYADGLLVVEAREFLGDGLFKNGFDPEE